MSREVVRRGAEVEQHTAARPRDGSGHTAVRPRDAVWAVWLLGPCGLAAASLGLVAAAVTLALLVAVAVTLTVRDRR